MCHSKANDDRYDAKFQEVMRALEEHEEPTVSKEWIVEMMRELYDLHKESLQPSDDDTSKEKTKTSPAKKLKTSAQKDKHAAGNSRSAQAKLTEGGSDERTSETKENAPARSDDEIAQEENEKEAKQPARGRQERIVSKQEVARMIEALKAKRMMDPDDPQNNKMTKQRALEIEAFYRKNRSLTKGQVVKIFMEVYQLHRSSLRRLMKRIEEGKSIRQSKKGRVGRKAVQLPQETVDEMIKLAKSNLQVSIQALAKRYGVDRRVVKRYLDEAKVKRFSSQELRMMRFALSGKEYKPWNPKEVEEDKQKVRERIKKYQARKKAGLVDPQNNHNWRRKVKDQLKEQAVQESIIATITPEEMNAAVIMSETAAGTSVIHDSRREAKSAVDSIVNLLPTSTAPMAVSTVVTISGNPMMTSQGPGVSTRRRSAKSSRAGAQRQTVVTEAQPINVNTIQLHTEEVSYEHPDQEGQVSQDQQQITYQIQYNSVGQPGQYNIEYVPWTG